MTMRSFHRLDSHHPQSLECRVDNHVVPDERARVCLSVRDAFSLRPIFTATIGFPAGESHGAPPAGTHPGRGSFPGTVRCCECSGRRPEH